MNGVYDESCNKDSDSKSDNKAELKVLNWTSFEVLLSNATSMDPRTMALDTNSNDLHFGFNINRQF